MLFVSGILAGLCVATALNSTLVSPFTVSYNSQHHPLYAWEDLHVSVSNPGEHRVLVSEQRDVLQMSGMPASQLTSYKVFVSLTTISSRIATVWKSIYTLLNGLVRPTQIFLFVSRDPYLIDQGVQAIPNNLLSLVQLGLLRIVYTDNIGPHRKLLPLLAKHYEDNSTVIVNVDDDMSYSANSTLLFHLLHRFLLTNESSVVALRSRRIGLCNGRAFRYTRYYSWNVLYTTGRSEMLLLPTGTGGILYRPQFFHPVVFSNQFRLVTGTGDDLMFRLSCMANAVPVTIACRDLEYKGRIVRRCPVDLSTAALTSQRPPMPLRARPGRGLPFLLPSDQSEISVPSRQLYHESLYAINRNGRNDEQFRGALTFLASQSVIPKFGDVIAQHYSERDAKCYELHNKNQAYCSIYSCAITKTTTKTTTTTTVAGNATETGK